MAEILSACCAGTIVLGVVWAIGYYLTDQHVEILREERQADQALDDYAQARQDYEASWPSEK